ncbi:hypothetical protein MNB_SM-7-1383 [hydrothermal vent metagenome]|uniref:Uncharacterized protein n=1 Tax=hydrothermal vent metagenome TaxID=652676 RepID=A0A1W1BZ24_9ZZZZ
MLISSLFAKKVAIVIQENQKLLMDESLKKEIQSLFTKEDIYLKGKNSIEILFDKNRKIKKIFTSGGAQKLVEFALQRGYSSLALVEYKKSSKTLNVVVFVADKKVQDRKSKHIAFNPRVRTEDLAKTLLASVLTLNYELGVLDAKKVY